MGKRSDFERVPRDFYPTPFEAVIPLLNCIHAPLKFSEPCVGKYDLASHLIGQGLECVQASDIDTGTDALSLTLDDLNGADVIITNPPWDRKLLHPMIDHFRNMKPTWLLFDADWMHTKQSADYIGYCKRIVSVGRVKWIPDSKMTGKDNCCWYLFDKSPVMATEFEGRTA